MLIIIAFILLYMPPVLPFSSLHIIAILSWFHIFKHQASYRVLYNVHIKKVILNLFAIMFYLFVIMIANGRDVIDIVEELYSRLGAVTLEMIPVACYLVYNATKRRVDVIDLIIYAATIQGIISIITFFVPNIQNLIISTMVNNGYSEAYLNFTSYRLYGVSYSMLFGMPIANSIISMLALYRSFSKGWKYVAYTMLIIFPAIINARISFIVLIYSLFYMLYELVRTGVRMKSKRVTRILMISGLILVVGIFLFNYMSENNQRIISGWINGIQNTIALVFAKDNASTYYTYYRGTAMWQLPDGLISKVFGTGQRVIRGNTEYQSDIGYINDIWLGGYIYSLLIYLFAVKESIHLNSWFRKTINLRQMGVILLLIVLTVNIKGSIIGINEVMALFSILIVVSNRRVYKCVIH